MIPFVDLKSQFKDIERDVRTRMDAVLQHGQFILGPEIKELEQKLAAFTGTRHCISCASGTDALYMSLLAKGVGTGDVIFTTPFTFFATAETIALAGATPIFVDIDPSTFNMAPTALARALEAFNKRDPSIHPLPASVTKGSAHKARGVMAVDIFGLPSDYDAIHGIAREHGLWVIEDAAQFGLTQLHQLRGRVGRGSVQSYWFLAGTPKTREGRDRLDALCRFSSGFDIAEEDLKMRGPGEFFGQRQSGLTDLRAADLLRDVRLLELAREDAEALLDTDPRLESPELAPLRARLHAAGVIIV